MGHSFFEQARGAMPVSCQCMGYTGRQGTKFPRSPCTVCSGKRAGWSIYGKIDFQAVLVVPGEVKEHAEAGLVLIEPSGEHPPSSILARSASGQRPV
jgi:hypothetical protein